MSDPETGNRGPGQSPVQVVQRSLRILEALSSAPGAVNLTELSRLVGLHRSTLLRILRTLADDGYAVFESSSRRWTIGPSVLRLQAGARAKSGLRQTALPVMKALCSTIGQTVQLGVLLDDEVSYLEKVEPPDQQIKVLSEIGSRRPLHCTGLGKALLAGLLPAELETILDRLDLIGFTDSTITDKALLRRDIKKSAMRGYSIDHGEYNSVIRCTAATVHDTTGRSIAALSVSVIGLDIRSEAFQSIVRENVAAANAISRALGGDER